MNVLPNLASLRATAYSFLLALGFSGAVGARPATQDFGQPFPNIINRSLNPQWRVYIVERDGVRYVQINDLFGHLRTIFAEGNGDVLVTPVGIDASNVERVVVIPTNGMSQCGRGCSNGAGLGSFGMTQSTWPKTSSMNKNSLIYEDATLRIRVGENAAHQATWQVITLPSEPASLNERTLP